MANSNLTLDALLAAQRNLLSSGNTNDDQKRLAQQQINKLEAIRAAMMLSNLGKDSQSESIERITKNKGDPSHTTLGDVKKEVQGLRVDVKNLKNTVYGTSPREGREPLESIFGSKIERKEESQEERSIRLKRIGNLIEKRTVLEKGGSRPETLAAKNTATFERFIAETSKRDSILADASNQQKEIFERIENTLIKLKEAGTEESKLLRDELAAIAGELEVTDETKAKAKIAPILQNARISSTIGQRGQEGSFGDVFSALLGNRSVLKKDFKYDTRGGSGFVNIKTGRFAKASEAKMGRLGSASSIFGNVLANMAERSIENRRSEGIQRFFDNFRTTTNPSEGNVPNLSSRSQRINELQNEQWALQEKNIPNSASNITSKSSTNSSFDKNIEAKVVNISADIINITKKSRIKEPKKEEISSEKVTEDQSIKETVTPKESIREPNKLYSDSSTRAPKKEDIKEVPKTESGLSGGIYAALLGASVIGGGALLSKIFKYKRGDEQEKTPIKDMINNVTENVTEKISTIKENIKELSPIEDIKSKMKEIRKNHENGIVPSKSLEISSELKEPKTFIEKVENNIKGFFSGIKSKMKSERSKVDPSVTSDVKIKSSEILKTEGILDIPNKTGLSKETVIPKKTIPPKVDKRILDILNETSSSKNTEKLLETKETVKDISNPVPVVIVDSPKILPKVETKEKIFDTKTSKETINTSNENIEIEKTPIEKFLIQQQKTLEDTKFGEEYKQYKAKQNSIVPKENVKMIPNSSSIDLSSKIANNNSLKTNVNNTPVIINNNNQVISNTSGNNQLIAPRGKVRSEESAMEQYAKRNAHFF